MKTWSLPVRKSKYTDEYAFKWEVKTRNWVHQTVYKPLDSYLQSEGSLNKVTLICITKGWFGWWATFQSQGW